MFKAFIFFTVIGLVVVSALAAIYALTRYSMKDRHTWLNELFGSEEA